MPEEKDQISKEKLLEYRFIQYISMLSNSVMIHLGKIMNPVSGKVERDLDAARATIDIISMLKEKTKGNLSDDEDRFLTGTIANLQLNYVDEVNKDKEEAQKKQEKKEEESKEEEQKEQKPGEETKKEEGKKEET